MATLVLTGLSIVAIGQLDGGWRPIGDNSCVVPAQSAPVVNVTVTNMGGPMVGGSTGMMRAGAMRLVADTATVQHGTVTFLVSNRGSVSHEMLILPLQGSQLAGERAIGGDGKVDETGSLGEASNSCGSGVGDGIPPGSSSWVTVNLTPGRYELVCNLPGHYAAGMYTQLTVE
ncbi:sulfocyanin-like copper-binding protein [Gryllotalpicola sp.]|uniref:sulfocyanin-like copper-binding protein n=1 Tax=Gryllotalpicola sp. TaxID=1932787 RepID=UPI00261D9734|nr:sulfocyanin-like copper-binding protein [Gryllotalpicola sp.]